MVGGTAFGGAASVVWASAFVGVKVSAEGFNAFARVGFGALGLAAAFGFAFVRRARFVWNLFAASGLFGDQNDAGGCGASSEGDGGAPGIMPSYQPVLSM